MINLLQTPPINFLIDSLLNIQKEKEEIYLVGGFVRDLILQRKIDDIDLAVIGPVRDITKRLADYLNSPFYILNDTFNAARIIWSTSKNNKIKIDLVETRGETIESDLFLRDFTINALAINIKDLNRIIDPYGGMLDINQKIVRSCNNSTFDHDPVRILRAIRQSVNLKFAINQTTINLLKKSIAKINQVSAERIRDELFKSLDSFNTHQIFLILYHLKLLDHIFPQFCEYIKNDDQECKLFWEHSLEVLRILSKLLIHLTGPYSEGKVNDLYQGEIILHLGRYRFDLENYFFEEICGERNRLSLLYFVGLLHDGGKILLVGENEIKNHLKENTQTISAELIKNISKDLAMSSNETDCLVKIIKNQTILHLAAISDQNIDDRWIYRFIKLNKEDGIMLIFISLADTLTQIFKPGMEDRLYREIKISRKILDAYFGQDTSLRSPHQYLNGHEIMAITGMSPGPQLGKLLSAIEEETAIKNINSKADVLAFIKTNYEN